MVRSDRHVFGSKSITVEKETPLDVDVGFLAVTDLNAIDEEAYQYAPHHYSQEGLVHKIPN